MSNIRKLYIVSLSLPMYSDFHEQEIGTRYISEYVLAMDKIDAYKQINKKYGYFPNKKCKLADATESKCLGQIS